MVKNPPANTEDTRDEGSSPGPGRSLGEAVVTHSSILAWEILRTEELGRLQSMGSQRVRHNLMSKDACIFFLLLTIIQVILTQPRLRVNKFPFEKIYPNSNLLM